MQTLVKQLGSTASQATILELIQNLRRLNTIQKKQWQSNPSVQNMLELDQFMTAVRQQINQAGDKVATQEVYNILNDLSKKIVNNPKIVRDLSMMKRDLLSIQKVDNQTKKIVEIQFAKQKIQQQKKNLAIGSAFNISTISSPFEMALQPYQPLLRNVPMTTDVNNLPQSVRFLATYAQIQNKIPLGPVTNQKGTVYVGLEQIQQNGRVITIPMMTNQVQQSSIPDIPMQIRYHSNKTINSWNNFIQDQSELVQYMKKVSTPQDRIKYLETQFRDLSLTAFKAQALATITYYYYYLPLLKFFKSTISGGTQVYTQGKFQADYSLSSNIKENPLFLKKSEGLQIAKIVMGNADGTNNTVKDVYQRLTDKLVGYKAKGYAKQRIDQFLMYTKNRAAESQQFFMTSGVPKNIASQLLDVDYYYGVKEKKLYFQQTLQNNQLTSLVRKVLKGKSQNKQKKKQFSFTWQSQSIPCYDYIYKNNIY